MLMVSNGRLMLKMFCGNSFKILLSQRLFMSLVMHNRSINVSSVVVFCRMVGNLVVGS